MPEAPDRAALVALESVIDSACEDCAIAHAVALSYERVPFAVAAVYLRLTYAQLTIIRAALRALAEPRP